MIFIYALDEIIALTSLRGKKQSFVNGNTIGIGKAPSADEDQMTEQQLNGLNGEIFVSHVRHSEGNSINPFVPNYTKRSNIVTVLFFCMVADRKSSFDGTEL